MSLGVRRRLRVRTRSHPAGQPAAGRRPRGGRRRMPCSPRCGPRPVGPGRRRQTGFVAVGAAALLCLPGSRSRGPTPHPRAASTCRPAGHSTPAPDPTAASTPTARRPRPPRARREAARETAHPRTRSANRVQLWLRVRITSGLVGHRRVREPPRVGFGLGPSRRRRRRPTTGPRTGGVPPVAAPVFRVASRAGFGWRLRLG